MRDLNRALAFYQRVLGLHEVERIGNQYAFLTAGSLHHEVALHSVGPNAPTPSPLGTGLYHMAFEVPDKAALAGVYFKLVEAGIDVAPVDHLISWAIYFTDPDGNGLELYCDTRKDAEGATLWRGKNKPLTGQQFQAAQRREALVSA